MRTLAVITLLLGLALTTVGPAMADCLTDINEARKVVNNMPDGREKYAALRELKLAEEALAAGDEPMCIVHVGVCTQYVHR